MVHQCELLVSNERLGRGSSTNLGSPIHEAFEFRKARRFFGVAEPIQQQLRHPIPVNKKSCCQILNSLPDATLLALQLQIGSLLVGWSQNNVRDQDGLGFQQQCFGLLLA